MSISEKHIKFGVLAADRCEKRLRGGRMIDGVVSGDAREARCKKSETRRVRYVCVIYESADVCTVVVIKGDEIMAVVVNT